MVQTGKIQKDSANIYEDEARILFNFYQRQAEKIVREEEALEAPLKEAENKRRDLEYRMSGWWNKFINFLCFRTGRLRRELVCVSADIENLKNKHANIYRGYHVNKLGVAYVPVASQVKYGNKSFIVDYAGNVDTSRITLQMPRNQELLTKTISDIDQLMRNVPAVETTNEVETIDTNEYSLSIQEVKQGDYTGKIDRSLRTISYCMSDMETASVELPLVPEGSDYISYLQEFSTSEPAADAPVVDVFGQHRYDDSVEKFQELNRLKDSLATQSSDFEQTMQALLNTLAFTVQTVSASKLATTDKLINHSNALLFQILKSPYNHYSPNLEAEEIKRIKEETFDYKDNVQGYEPFSLKQSSRVYYNLHSGEWIAENGAVSTVPFGVHQIYEEIVAPVVQNLMAENRIERLKIYNHIFDQKLSYVNKWHQDVDAFYRSNHAESADIINNMQNTLAEYVEAYNVLVQLQNTMKSMEGEVNLDNAVVKTQDKGDEVLATFEAEAQSYKQVQQEFTDFMDRLQEDIAAKAEEFGHVEFYDARLRDGYSNRVAAASDKVAMLDERRKGLAQANPLLAEDSLLPPQPSVEDATYENLSINLQAMAKNALEELNDLKNEGVQDELEESTPETPADEASNDIELQPAEDQAQDVDEELTDLNNEDVQGELDESESNTSEDKASDDAEAQTAEDPTQEEENPDDQAIDNQSNDEEE